MQLQCDYQRDGYLVLRNFFSTREVLRLVELVDRIHAIWLEKNQAMFTEQGLINMHSLTSPEYFQDAKEERLDFFKAIAPVKLVEMLDELFETEIYFHNTQLFFNPHNPAQLPYWHRDLQFSPIPDEDQKAQQSELLSLHVRIPLVKEVGMEFVPGTHNRWDTPLEHSVRLELDGHKNSENLPGSVLVDLSPGDVMVFNAQMIHRGNYTQNESRKALDLCVGAAHPFTRESLDPAVLPDAEEMACLANNTWYERAWQVAGR